MRDVHCHILPGVDDGAFNLEESLEMIQAAKQAGITSIVCTPHCRDPFFNYEDMLAAYDLLVSHADGFPLIMGFEVYHSKLMDLGLEWAEKLSFNNSNELLLELSNNAGDSEFAEYEKTIRQLHQQGYQVIIAHPERYRLVQKNTDIAKIFISWGCKLQASADFIAGGIMDTRRATARRLMKQGLYAYVASDAHCVHHYSNFVKAVEKYDFVE